jgi:hypothetical protein
MQFFTKSCIVSLFITSMEVITFYEDDLVWG